MVAEQARNCVVISTANRAQEFASLFLLLFEIQDSSFVCLVRMTGERGSTSRGCLKEAGGRSPFRGQDAFLHASGRSLT